MYLPCVLLSNRQRVQSSNIFLFPLHTVCRDLSAAAPAAARHICICLHAGRRSFFVIVRSLTAEVHLGRAHPHDGDAHLFFFFPEGGKKHCVFLPNKAVSSQLRGLDRNLTHSERGPAYRFATILIHLSPANMRDIFNIYLDTPVVLCYYQR